MISIRYCCETHHVRVDSMSRWSTVDSNFPWMRNVVLLETISPYTFANTKYERVYCRVNVPADNMVAGTKLDRVRTAYRYLGTEEEFQRSHFIVQTSPGIHTNTKTKVPFVFLNQFFFFFFCTPPPSFHGDVVLCKAA